MPFVCDGCLKIFDIFIIKVFTSVDSLLLCLFFIQFGDFLVLAMMSASPLKPGHFGFYKSLGSECNA